MANVYTPLFTDTFTRPNETPLNPVTWTDNVSGYDPLSVVSDLCADETFEFSGWEFANVVLPNDQYAEITISSLVNSDSNLQLYIRGDATSNLFFYYLDWSAVTGVLNLYETTNSHEAPNLLGTATIAPVPGDVLHLEAVGTSIVAKHNGTTVISASDSNIPSGSSGVLLNPADEVSDVTISKFVTGSVTQGGPVNYYSEPDCRDYATFPNNAIDVNGTETYTVQQFESRKAGAPIDSRVSPPVACGTYPQNNRAPGEFGPDE